MREQYMGYCSDNLHRNMHDAAEKAIEMCAQGLLSAESVAQRMWQEWVMKYREAEEMPSHNVLMRLALRICSYELCIAWKSPDVQRCELAYTNLLRYLRVCLMQTRYGVELQTCIYAVDDILNSTVETLCREVTQKERIGPDDPAAFLKWAQTIMIRQAHLYVERSQREKSRSLDEQRELLAESCVDTKEHDPLRQVLLQELRQILNESIQTIGNIRYQQVLWYSFLAEMEEQELAQKMHVSVAEIYLWKHRALHALRRKPEVMNVLRIFL